MAEASVTPEVVSKEDGHDSIQPGSNHEDKANTSHGDDGSDDVFSHTDTLEVNHHRKEHSPTDHGHKARSRERHHSRHSSQGSHDQSSDHDGVTKTELIRASAKRAQIERQRKSSNENDKVDVKHKRHHATSPSLHHGEANKGSHKKTHSNIRKPSSSFTDRGEQRRTSPRSSQRNGSASPHRKVSPKRSLSTSPKHQGHVIANSKTSLLSKPSTSMASSPQRTGSDITGQSGVTTALIPRTQVTSTHSYSRPAMEVAVAGLLFGGGLVTLIVSLIIGSNAWMIVGAISMSIGGVFIAFGACFYISRNKPLLSIEERLEIRLVDTKQLAELSSDGFKVDL